MGIRITEVEIIPLKPRNGLIAIASCLYCGQLALNSIAIYSRPDGSSYRLVYPTKVLANGKEIHIFYPINKRTGDAITRAIVRKYEELMKK